VGTNHPARTVRHPRDYAAPALTRKLLALATQATECHRAGRIPEAITQYDRMLALAPHFSEVHNNRGLALAELGRFEEAVDAYRRALDIRPDSSETLCNLGVALSQLERYDEAEAKFRRSIAANPGFAGAYNNLGLIMKERGRMAEARLATEHAIRLSPRNPSYYDNLAVLRSFTSGDPYATALEELAVDGASLSAVDQMHLNFALAKAYEQMGRTDSAFARVRAGNAFKRRQITYDEAATLGQMNRTPQLFSRESIQDRRGFGERSAVPIFIVGMPRSGTTLIEQILASHPEVFGAGELNLFEQAIDAVRAAVPLCPPFPDLVPAMSAEHFRNLGALYLEGLTRRAPDAARITDKMPGNFVFVGMMHLALPDATIIHAIRDPVDTCVSCFFVHFARGHSYSYDLAELGRYYRQYRALMAHWRRVLPTARIIDVRYEDLVADLEGVARRIIAHCGLIWDARCLDFYRTERPVRTASAPQVRQPIYKTSVGRSRAYEKFLGPLIAELTADAGENPL
jgi:Flp pilus assembly protein TadD